MTKASERRVDVVTMDVIGNALEGISDEMFITLQHTGRSMTATQTNDMSAGIADATGEIVSTGKRFGHTVAATQALRLTLKKFEGRIEEGDIFIQNDPYSGSNHMPDVSVYKPVFIDGELCYFTHTVVHHTDIGGRAPGSLAHDATEIYQEGLRIPPIKLYDRGQLNETLWDMIEKNTRGDSMKGDLRAQVAACFAGEAKLKELVGRYGQEQLHFYCEALKDYSERLVRAAIAQWPDGEYEYEDYIDEDGVDPDPVVLHVKLTIKGDEVFADYTGTSPQVRGSINIHSVEGAASVFGAIRMVTGLETPNNSGVFRPIHVYAPPGTVVSMVEPASCGARGVTGFRLRDVWMGVLSKVVPDKVVAANEGGTSTGRYGFVMPESRYVVLYDNVYGSPGGRTDRDAYDGMGMGLTNASIEVIESRYPIRIRRYGFVPDTGGPGKHRGALAITREWEFLQESNFTFRSDRRRFRPYGLFGGEPGHPSVTYRNPDKENELMPAKMNTRFQRGDVLSHITAGGGGLGDPLERDPQRVFEDYLEEKMSAAHAREAYGVVLDPDKGEVQDEETARLRQQMREKRR